MKYLLSLCLSLFSLSIAHAQIPEFEGYIEYTHKFKITGPGSSLNQLKTAFGTSSIYYYKNGHYKWVFKGSRAQFELYDPARNMFYVDYATQDPAVIGSDTAVQVLKDAILPGQTKVAGYNCKQYRITSVIPDKGTWTRVFSYASQFVLNPVHFAQCGSNDLKHVYKVIKAMPLKIEIMGLGDFEMTYEATKVVPKKLDDAMFKFPE